MLEANPRGVDLGGGVFITRCSVLGLFSFCSRSSFFGQLGILRAFSCERLAGLFAGLARRRWVRMKTVFLIFEGGISPML